MLSVQPKRTDSVKYVKEFEKYIRKNYDKRTLETLSPFLTELEQARSQITSSQASSSEQASSSLQSNALYYRYLKAIESRLPVASTDIKFTWFDSLGKGKSQASNYSLEKLGVLYNIGAIYSKLGADIDLKSPDGPKLGLNYFQVAAGCFDEARKLAVEQRQVTTADTSPEHLSFLTNILIAQAYLCMYDKLDKTTASKVNLSKLSQTASKNFGQAYELALNEILSRSVPDETRLSLRYQQLVYSAAARYWISFIEREQGSKTGKGFGKGVARLRSAYDAIQKAMQIKGIRGPMLDVGRNLLTLIANEKESAEQDNMRVYIDNIPDHFTLSDPEDVNMIQPKFPPMVDIMSPIAGQDVLEILVSPEVLQRIAEYKDILQTINIEENEKAGLITREISQNLEAMNLPHKLDATSGENGIPEAVWKKIQNIQSQGGVNQLEQSFNNVMTLNANNAKYCVELEGNLTREAQEDATLRNNHGSKWTRIPSNEANAQLKHELNTLRVKLAQANEIDQKNKQMFDRSQGNLNLLKKSRSELDVELPSGNSLNGQRSQSASSLSEALKTLETHQKLLHEKMTELGSSIEQDNITESLIRMEETKMNKESVFNQEILKFRPIREEIDRAIADLRNDLELVRKCNSVFDSDRTNSQGNPARIEFLQRVEDASKVYYELTGNIAQGIQFHSTLSRHLSVLHQKILEYVNARTAEKNSLLGGLEKQNKGPVQQIPYGMSQAQPQAYFPQPSAYPYQQGAFQQPPPYFPPGTYAPQQPGYNPSAPFMPPAFPGYQQPPGQFPPPGGFMPPGSYFPQQPPYHK
ncbi:unnamed protein product [Blepharisma stoltei]|uniref:BRO1 domain-containing protein n=1 Tax=Blepharisma stoltei TaxID=1481888 RepID=A0AAU9J0Q2_9CILI|nr:unnamed protein product [Blepharisma stoltei]